MYDIPLSNFMNKVLSTRERVQFSYIDMFGHMNANRFIELALNHRSAAGEDILRISTRTLVEKLKIGFIVNQLSVKFVSPAFLGEWLEISSWTSKLNTSDFEVLTVIAGEKSRKVKAVLKIGFKCVDLSTGRTCELPPALTTEYDTDVTTTLKSSHELIESLKGYPSEI